MIEFLQQYYWIFIVAFLLIVIAFLIVLLISKSHKKNIRAIDINLDDIHFPELDIKEFDLFTIFTCKKAKNINHVLFFAGEKETNKKAYYPFFNELTRYGIKIIFSDNTNDPIYFRRVVDRAILLGEAKKGGSLMVFGNGANVINSHSFLFRKIIFVSPKYYLSASSFIKKNNIPALFLYCDEDSMQNATHEISMYFADLKKCSDVTFTPYPFYGHFLFADKTAANYHDKMDTIIRRFPNKFDFARFDVNKYSSVSLRTVNDTINYLNDKKPQRRVALFSDSYLPINNGVNILVRQLKEELTKNGYLVYIIAPRIKDYDYFYSEEENLALFKSFRLNNQMGRQENLYISPYISSTVHKLAPYRFDIIHLQTEFSSALISYKLAQRDNIPFVYTLHTMWIDMIYKRWKPSISHLMAKAANAIFLNAPPQKADVFTVPTHKVERDWLHRYRKHIAIIPGCINLKKFDIEEGGERKVQVLRNQLGLEGKHVLGFVGRICKEKKLQEVISYFDQYAQTDELARLVVVGNGSYLNEAKRRASLTKHPDWIIFVGEKPNDELKYYYRLFNCFVTSSTFETQGLTYVEAMASDTILLVRDDPCLQGFAIDYHNAFLYKNYDEFSSRLNVILNDSKTSNKIKQNAKKTIALYQPDKWAKKFIELYNYAVKIKNKEIDDIPYKDNYLIDD